MYHGSAQGVDERMINGHYYYYYAISCSHNYIILLRVHWLRVQNYSLMLA